MSSVMIAALSCASRRDHVRAPAHVSTDVAGDDPEPGIEAAVATERSDRRTRTGDQWLDSYFPYLLYRASEKLQLRLHSRLRALRMSSSQWRVISVLKAYGALSIGEIVEATLMEQPTISRVVARLEKTDLVARRPSTRDSRMTLIAARQR